MLIHGFSNPHFLSDTASIFEIINGVFRNHFIVDIHAITHAIGFAYEEGPRIQGETKRVMIASAPGSEHLLGPTVVSEFFRREGWQVVVEISPSAKELAQAVAGEWFDTVGLSVSINQQLSGLDALVAQIGRAEVHNVDKKHSVIRHGITHALDGQIDV